RGGPRGKRGRNEVRVVAHGEVKPAGYDDGVDAGVAPSPLPLKPEVVAVPPEDRHQWAVRELGEGGIGQLVDALVARGVAEQPVRQPTRRAVTEPSSPSLPALAAPASPDSEPARATHRQ